jgi:putative intracellular protease/amidase
MNQRARVLLVATNTSRVPGIGRRVGAWLSEIVYFYHPVTQAGVHVDIASPNGGIIPLDPIGPFLATPLARRYLNDLRFMASLRESIPVREVDARDYNGIFFAGGHGPIVDFPDDAAIQQIVADVYEKGGLVAAVCHGPIALLNVRNRDGSFFVSGRPVTGCSNAEEAILGLKRRVPFLLETEMRKRGALYRKSAIPVLPATVVSDRLITGQNNLATAHVAAEFLKALNLQRSVGWDVAPAV